MCVCHRVHTGQTRLQSPEAFYVEAIRVPTESPQWQLQAGSSLHSFFSEDLAAVLIDHKHEGAGKAGASVWGSGLTRGLGVVSALL